MLNIMNDFQTVNDVVNESVRNSSYYTVAISSCVFILYTFSKKWSLRQAPQVYHTLFFFECKSGKLCLINDPSSQLILYL